MKHYNTDRVMADISITLVLAFAVILVILLYFVSPKKDSVNEAPPPQGNMIIELYWPDTTDMDVDLWVKSEEDSIAVGYSNKGGPVFNLLRDDLGVIGDISGRNMEITYSRGIPDGEYIINAHLFNLKAGKLPVPVKLVVSVKEDDDKQYNQIFSVDTELVFSGEEKTLARFVMYDKKFIKESFSSLQQNIRAYVPEK